MNTTHYAWVITFDHLEQAADRTAGPRGSRCETVDELKAAYPVVRKFKMFDDDGELYYTGFIGVSKADNDGELLFAPLEDYGTPAAGCTRIDYKNLTTGAWEVL